MTRFLYNRWYQVAWAEELTLGETLSRRILDVPILFYRTSDGGIAAMQDRCPHRFAPLSEGILADDVIACPYHGLRFDRTGRCVHNPHGAAVRALDAQGYQVIERHKAIWLWIGKTPADDTKLPDLSFIDEAPETGQCRGYTHVAANYELLVDNIMDLSHADYLHPTSLGSGFNTRAKSTIEEHGESLKIAWRADSEEPPPAFRMDSPAKLWTEVDWHAPAIMVLRAGGHAVGRPEEAIDGLNLHSMTPETATTSHYFTCNTRSFLRDDAAFNEVFRRELNHAFQMEDKPMVEKIQQLMGTPDLWSLGPVMLTIDGGPVRARRCLAALIDAQADDAGAFA